MKFHSSPVWKFFLIKFHLLQLGFHHPITGRRAEALVHASFHQAPGEYQSMPPIVFYFSLSISYVLPLFLRPFHTLLSSLATSPHLSLPSVFFISLKNPPLLAPCIVVSCKTHCLAQQNDNSPERRLQHPQHSAMTEHHGPTSSHGLKSTVWSRLTDAASVCFHKEQDFHHIAQTLSLSVHEQYVI